MGVMCDGHNGRGCADALEKHFHKETKRRIEDMSPSAPKEALARLLDLCFREAVEEAERMSTTGGSTFAAFLVQRSTGMVTVLHLGDSRIGMADAETGELLTCRRVYHEDQAEEEENRAPEARSLECQEDETMSAITRNHSFLDNKEMKRYHRALMPIGWAIARWPHRSAAEAEGRWQAGVYPYNEGLGALVCLPEPSRTVEATEDYGSKIPPQVAYLLHRLQRVPEISIYQVPENRKILIFAVCDGFESKSALPGPERLAFAIARPFDALCSPELLKGTMVSKFIGKKRRQRTLPVTGPVSGSWSPEGTALATIEAVREGIYDSLPDAMWKQAYDTSYGHVMKLIRKVGSGAKAPNITDISKRASLQLLAHLAVVLLSDDNVSIEALVMEPRLSSSNTPKSPAGSCLSASSCQLEYLSDMECDDLAVLSPRNIVALKKGRWANVSNLSATA